MQRYCSASAGIPILQTSCPHFTDGVNKPLMEVNKWHDSPKVVWVWAIITLGLKSLPTPIDWLCSWRELSENFLPSSGRGHTLRASRWFQKQSDREGTEPIVPSHSPVKNDGIPLWVRHLTSGPGQGAAQSHCVRQSCHQAPALLLPQMKDFSPKDNYLQHMCGGQRWLQFYMSSTGLAPQPPPLTPTPWKQPLESGF